MASTQSVRQRVLDVVRSRIINLVYLPGMPISENDLAAQLGVSRTPVREAILRLAEEHLVDVVPRVGTYVSRVDMTRVRASQFAREAIECASLRALSLPLSAEQVAQIEAILAAQERAVADAETDTFFLLDEEFHAALMRIAGHGAAWEIVSATKVHLDRARIIGFKEVSPISFYYEQHRAIFDSVLAGDVDVAISRMEEHLRLVLADAAKAQTFLPEFFKDEGDDAAPRIAALPNLFANLAKKGPSQTA
ncbi:GntR family transcriptional regulator [Trueperella sp.]|uniref:GntR family transcriptional regulator n=1 Tax=Trueperella sp. TaxID=2699835 RepID=UPI0022EA74FE|nr:GntR family transcriptional regulator [Trueperella sp.]